MELLYKIFGIVHIIVCVLLIIFILLQKGTGDGLFTSSNSSNPFMSGIEVVNFLSTATKYLGVFFLINTVFLAFLSVKIANKNKVVVEESYEQQRPLVPVGSK